MSVAYSDADPLDITWVKINPVGETIDEDERAKREAEKQRNVYRKTGKYTNVSPTRISNIQV